MYTKKERIEHKSTEKGRFGESEKKNDRRSYVATLYKSSKKSIAEMAGAKVREWFYRGVL